MKKILTYKKIILILIFICSQITYSQVVLPKLISDGMVLQRDAKIKIWGWASKNEEVKIHFIDSTYITKTNQVGEWSVNISELKSGGPYEMQIDASNSIKIKDILVGDVWVCSGQSNMGLPLGVLKDVYKDEISEMNNPMIRQFSTFPRTNFSNRDSDFKFGIWQHADSNNIYGLTAAGYFFAKNIYEIYKVPIGLLNVNMGGSAAEAWISEESMKEFPIYYKELLKFKSPGYLELRNKQDDERANNWNRMLRINDIGLKDEKQLWSDPNLNISNWESMQIPGYWADTKVGNVNGVIWFRKEFYLTDKNTNGSAYLKLGRIVDCDSVFINGKFIGSTGSQYMPRNYEIQNDILNEGKNVIVVRVINYIHKGGFVPGKKYELLISGQKINLAGEWNYKIGATSEQLDDHLFTGKIPTGLFNGGIAPLLNYNIKGVLWYQGESNTSRAFEHYDLFKLLIKDWRKNWKQGDFPFIFVQLPNFVEVNVERTNFDWAIFRESQLKSLSIPNTGMAVAIDIGEYNDIHPVNKKDIGARLALAARKVAYNEQNIVYSGPIYKSMEIIEDKVILSFSNSGSGLVVKGGKLKSFEICGIDNEFYPAEAKIENNKILVWCSKVLLPVAVRYAWNNNPEDANLYNKEGLPASPFRTSELY